MPGFRRHVNSLNRKNPNFRRLLHPASVAALASMTSETQAPLSGFRVLITGGTIDKVYRATEGQLGFERTQVLEMLRQARAPLPEECVQTILLKDSLDMVDADRAALAAACLAAPEPRLLITHGTDTMVQTAQHLAACVPGRTIVLTGAMIPFSVSHSDALFNFGFALAAVQLLPPGVYVAMNARVFPWKAVRKNRAAGWFEVAENESVDAFSPPG